MSRVYFTRSQLNANLFDEFEIRRIYGRFRMLCKEIAISNGICFVTHHMTNTFIATIDFYGGRNPREENDWNCDGYSSGDSTLVVRHGDKNNRYLMLFKYGWQTPSQHFTSARRCADAHDDAMMNNTMFGFHANMQWNVRLSKFYSNRAHPPDFTTM